MNKPPRPVWLDIKEWPPARGSKVNILTIGGVSTQGYWGPDCMAWMPLADTPPHIKYLLMLVATGQNDKYNDLRGPNVPVDWYINWRGEPPMGDTQTLEQQLADANAEIARIKAAADRLTGLLLKQVAYEAIGLNQNADKSMWDAIRFALEHVGFVDAVTTPDQWIYLHNALACLAKDVDDDFEKLAPPGFE